MKNYTASNWYKILRYTRLLRWIYETDPSELDIPDGYRLNRGERLRVYDEEEQKKRLGAELQVRGRRNPVSLVSSCLIAVLDDEDENLAFFIIELHEMDLLLRQNHIPSVLTRTGSFLQHALNYRLDTEEDLSPVIRSAFDNDELTFDEVRLAQFIRHCRNDVSHNFAYFPEWSYEVHDHAAVCSKTLLSSISESWYGVRFQVGNQLSAQNCIRVVEEEFGFTWDDDNDTYSKTIQEDFVTERGRDS